MPELPPVAAPGSYCEDVGSTLAAVAALMALWQVADGGHGQVVDVSSILALAQCTDLSLPLWSLLSMQMPRNGAGLYPLFECTDGLARIVLPMSAADWRSLIVWFGSPPEWTGPAWEKAMLGDEERDRGMARLPERSPGTPAAEVAADGDRAGVRITPVLTPAEVLSNEHVAARGTFAPVAVGESGTTGSVTTGLFGVGGTRRTTVPPPTLRGSSAGVDVAVRRPWDAPPATLPLAGCACWRSVPASPPRKPAGCSASGAPT